MQSTYRTFWRTYLLWAALHASSALAQPAQPVVGTVSFQIGQAQLERNNTKQPLAAGTALQEGDRIITGPDGHIHIRMVDTGFIAVRPASRLLIQAYSYNPQNPGANRVGLHLENGVARTISGKAGEAAREHYRFNTPVAAIGLRGTDYVVQALPDTTRVSVLKGAVTLSAFGPGCLATSLAPCVGPLVRELAAGMPTAYMEVRAQGGLPVLVTPENGSAAPHPNKAAPPRAEEVGGLPERQITNTLTAGAVLHENAAVSPPQPEPSAQITWGRWSSVALPNTPTVQTLYTEGREVTYANSLFALFRPASTHTMPVSGVVGMRYAQGEAYVTTAQGALSPAMLSNAKLTLDFAAREFSTSLNATTADASVYNLYAQGSFQFQGFLNADPARSNTHVSGVITNNASEAGYLFEAGLANGASLQGATRWKR